MPDNRAAKNRPVIDAELVRKLRELTGEGMMDCKKALHFAAGDIEKARERLRGNGRMVGRLVSYERPKSSYAEAMRAMQQAWNTMPPEEKLWFRLEDPLAMHSTVGQYLRNTVGMWNFPWTPEVRDGIDYSKDHPDAISMQVIRDFQEIVNKVVQA